MRRFIALSSDVVHPDFSLRRHKALLVQVFHVLDEAAALRRSFGDGDVHEDFPADKYSRGGCSRCRARSGFLVKPRQAVGNIRHRCAWHMGWEMFAIDQKESRAVAVAAYPYFIVSAAT